jgi:hypothetical protein
VSKLPPSIDYALQRYGLVRSVEGTLLEKLTADHYFRVVQKDASNVILALIADHFARQKGLRTLSDEQLGYINLTLNPQHPRRRRTISAMNLATAIRRLQAPKALDRDAAA